MLMMSANLVVAAVMIWGSPAVSSLQEATKPAPAAAPVTVPDTPAGKGLKEFIDSFNAGGEKRREWVEGRTTINKDDAANILQQDAQFLEEHGTMTIVRVPSATATNIVAIVKHAKTGAHGHLTLEVEATAPYKITNMQLRGATPEEIKGQ